MFVSMKNLFLILFIVINIKTGFTQIPTNVNISKSEFRLLKDGFKEAWEYVKIGEDFFEKGKIKFGHC